MTRRCMCERQHVESGGRALDVTPPVVHRLPEIRNYCPEVFPKQDIWIDGGIDRAQMSLGMRGLDIERPTLWELGAGGIESARRTLQHMKHGFV
jgi:isopentenyl diphosphate isomerase/L-lactate dehydrogenase-like FMN-dependent dehydrogenase